MKISITCITPVLQAILDFFPDIISFQHVLHLGVGRSQIEWKLKAKTQISVFPWAKIGQNDHSNPYIESTTVLSDNNYYYSFYLNLKDVDILVLILFIASTFDQQEKVLNIASATGDIELTHHVHHLHEMVYIHFLQYLQ